MRTDLRNDLCAQGLQDTLARIREVFAEVLESPAAQSAAAETIRRWPYEFKRYDLAQLVAGKGTGTAARDVVYAVSKQVKIICHKGRPYLSDGKQQVEIPGDVTRQVEFMMARPSVTQAAVHDAFPEMSEAAVCELFQNMKAMRVIA